MSTNYYMQIKPPCDCCKRPYESVHIGKSGGGWKFNFRTYSEHSDQVIYGQLSNSVRTFDEWKMALEGSVIVDEYNQEISVSDFISFVDSKQDLRSHSDDYPGGNYKDAKGYEMSEHEFS